MKNLQKLYIPYEITPKSSYRICRQIHECDEPYELYINSIGGDWDSGMAIYDVIQEKPCEVAICYGMVASMSSIILQASPKRQASKNCTFLLHHGTACFDGELNALFSHASRCKAMRKQMLNIYLGRCKHAPYFKNKSDKYIRYFINSRINKKGDWYFGSSDALKYGFIDEETDS